MSEKLSATDVLGSIDTTVKKEFSSHQRILAFDEYISILGAHPERHMRGSAAYAADMMDHFGKKEVASPAGGAPVTRFSLFDQMNDSLTPRVAGQEAVQNHIYRTLRTFSRQKFNNKLILLHGPNGSAKSSIAHALMAGMERYCQTQEGAAYSFNWVFPIERYTKGGIGIASPSSHTRHGEHLASFAKLPEEELASIIPCDMKDHPLLMIPEEHRKSFLEKLLGAKKANELWEKLPHSLTRGNLCHRCKQIADALLYANHGDFKKVLMHIQVERMSFSRFYRRGLVTIEPQLHVDAQYHQLSYNKSVSALPASVQNINLFTLTGDLIDGNRGIIEYSDLLKRPVDTFKYLLTACETSSVNVASTIAQLDTVMIGSSNDLQIDAFKEFPDFQSFKARIELVRVPYLLNLTDEQEIYSSQMSQFSGEKHLAPHVAWSVSLWSVLTRLKKPNTINYPPNLSSLVSNLLPIEKARLYDTGELPQGLSPEDKKQLKVNLQKIRDEYLDVPYYEGRMGASAREVKSILYDAGQNPEFPCLSPLAVLREIEAFVKHTSEYEFLKQDVKDGFHDAVDFINVVRNEYLNKIDREVRLSMGLYNVKQWEDFIKKYVQQISLVLKKEKTKNTITGQMEDPDFSLIEEFERIVEAPNGDSEKESFRQGIISQVGAWALDHPKKAVVYENVFPDFWRKLDKHYSDGQKQILSAMQTALQTYEPAHAEKSEGASESVQLVKQTLSRMKSDMNYCDHCAREVITFLMRSRY